jgi:hypothetical protein
MTDSVGVSVDVFFFTLPKFLQGSWSGVRTVSTCLEGRQAYKRKGGREGSEEEIFMIAS